MFIATKSDRKSAFKTHVLQEGKRKKAGLGVYPQQKGMSQTYIQ